MIATVAAIVQWLTIGVMVVAAVIGVWDMFRWKG